jgi:hypothetical protein
VTQTSTTHRGSQQAYDKNAIRPFHVNVPEEDRTDLRRRVNATKWPERETVTDASQGVQLATTQARARYWATEYDCIPPRGVGRSGHIPNSSITTSSTKAATLRHLSSPNFFQKRFTRASDRCGQT